MSASAMPRTLNNSFYPFFSSKIRTSLPKFKANDSVYIVSGPLWALSVSCIPCQAFNLHTLLIALAMILAHCCCEGQGGKSIIMRK